MQVGLSHQNFHVNTFPHILYTTFPHKLYVKIHFDRLWPLFREGWTEIQTVILSTKFNEIQQRMYSNWLLTNVLPRAIMRNVKKRQRGRGFTLPFDREEFRRAVFPEIQFHAVGIGSESEPFRERKRYSCDDELFAASCL